MDLETKVWLLVQKAPEQVFEAVANPRQMSRYFISAGSATMTPGAQLAWTWADKNLSLPVRVGAVEPGRRIEFTWAPAGRETWVRMTFEPAAQGATQVTVIAGDWPSDEAGMVPYFEQTQGWMHMLCCLKAYLEYGIDLRAGKAA
jgi:uncharacterized protein YndB with AHSA1/START domain